MSILVYKYLHIHLIIFFQQVLKMELWVKMYKFLKPFDRYCQINIELNTTWKKKHVENVLLKYCSPAVEKLIIPPLKYKCVHLTFVLINFTDFFLPFTFLMTIEFSRLEITCPKCEIGCLGIQKNFNIKACLFISSTWSLECKQGEQVVLIFITVSLLSLSVHRVLFSFILLLPFSFLS